MNTASKSKLLIALTLGNLLDLSLSPFYRWRILWPPDAKNWLFGKDPDVEKDWRQEKRMTEDEMVGWHHQLDRHECEQALEVGDVQGSLACCSPWGDKESDTDWATELTVEGVSHTLLVLQLGGRGHYDLANVDPGHCAPSFPKAPHSPALSLITDSSSSWMATHTGNRLHTLPKRLLFAAIAHQDPMEKRAQSA